MKQLTIQKKIILWFSAMLLIIVILISAMTFAIAGSVLNESIKERLHDIVYQNMAEIEYWNDLSSTEAEPGDQFLKYHDGWLEIDDDFCNVFEGISTALYDADGNLLYGNMPIKLSAAGTPNYTNIEKIKYKGENYYVFDKSLTVSGLEELWLRGVVSQNESTNILYNVVRLSFWLLPALAVLAILGGYIITRRSFLPVEQIAKSAEEIGKVGDLSKRLDIGPGNDEIHMLADTFNEMFARLENNFNAEKQFTSDASHELRTPVSVILAQSQYALEFAETSEEYRESLEAIERQGNRMGDIISQLLFFTRLAQGTETVTKENVCLSALVEEICAEQKMLPQEGRKNISLICDVSPDVYALTDRSLLTLCLNNLISNAYKYGKENGHIRVSLCRDTDKIIISVKDDGIGISPEDLPKIWERFYQADASRSADINERGLGLGLSMVSQVCKLLGITAEVNSTLGEGSEFVLFLPSQT